jgi:uncharacterized protein YceH (UPF0502 family)
MIAVNARERGGASAPHRCAHRYTARVLQLTPIESRVLGVLIEKAQTTPQQYPLSLNALTSGCNQKNNREPVTNFSDEQVFDALESLRVKGLVREVMLTGSRVQKYRHIAREVIEIGTSELVILAELLLRGPQTIGELRGRASRMHPFESTEIVKNVLDSLMSRAEPLVKQLPPAPGDRAARYAQLLCPELHPLDAGPPAASEGGGMSGGRGPWAAGRSGEAAAGAARDQDLIERVEALEREVAQLRQAIDTLGQSAQAADSD